MNNVEIPERINEKLAYLVGFISGDGHICVRKYKHEYSIFCTGNLIDEKYFYKNFIRKIFIDLFKITPKIRIDKKNNTINLVVYSKRLVFYLSDYCGIPIGAKSGKIKIGRIFNSSFNLKCAFIQGFVDADFSLCLKKRYKKIPYYPVISGTSKSKKVILEISNFLRNSTNITFSLNLNKIQYDNRFKNKMTVTHNIHIYGRKNLSEWVKIIGFRNSKYLKILKKLKI